MWLRIKLSVADCENGLRDCFWKVKKKRVFKLEKQQ